MLYMRCKTTTGAGCTHAESPNTCQVLRKQKMEGRSASGGTSSGSQPGQRKVPQLGCSGNQAVGGTLAHKSSAIFFGFPGRTGAHPITCTQQIWKCFQYRSRGEQTPQERLAHWPQNSSVRMLAWFRAARCWLAGSDPGCSVFVRCLG